MRIENQFDVQAPPERVYALMLDPKRIAPCIPGAEVTGARDDGGYDAQVTVRMGPVKMTYKGVVQIVEHDDAARTAAMRARGAEARGQGNVDATMHMAVTPLDEASSHVEVATEMQVTGRVAQMGQGIMQDVAVRMIGEMARNMEGVLNAETAVPATAGGEAGSVASEPSAAAPAPPPPAAPIKGGSLILRVLWDRLRRLFGGGRGG